MQGVMAVQDVSLHMLTWTCWWHLLVFQRFTPKLMLQIQENLTISGQGSKEPPKLFKEEF